MRPANRLARSRSVALSWARPARRRRRRRRRRADLYSLGCTFYFLLTGQVPFPGGTLLSKLG